LVVGIYSYVTKRNNVYGVEFSGGQVQEYLFEKPVSIQALRQAMKDIGMADVSIQQLKDNPREVVIRSSQESAEAVQKEFKTRFPEDRFDILKIEKIGPTVGRDLKHKAWSAIIYSMLGILIYVAFRFKNFDFAAGGVIALFHDVILAAGFIVFMNRQIDLLVITALLTIAGYSINDTIVIFDRIREIMRTRQKMSLQEMMNVALNQTLSRTFLTVFVTLFTVLAIFLWGGEVLNTFSLTLLFGFLVGAYSSIFIASPIVLVCRNLTKKI